MVKLMMELTRQESDKLAMLKIVWQKNSKQDVLKQLIKEQKIRIEDNGVDKK